MKWTIWAPFLLAALAASFALGIYVTPDKVRVETKVVEVVKQVEVEREKHKETTVTERPDGSKETKTVEDTKTQKNTEETKDSNTAVKESETHPSNKISISALGGFQTYNAFYPVYGLSISRPLIGPVVIGLWGITPGVVGVSLGLQF